MKYLGDYFNQVEKKTDLLNYQLKPAKWKAKIYPIVTSWAKPAIRVDIFLGLSDSLLMSNIIVVFRLKFLNFKISC